MNNITFTPQEMQTVVNVYNTFITMDFSGENIFKASDALKALRNFIETKDKEFVELAKTMNTPTEGEDINKEG